MMHGKRAQHTAAPARLLHVLQLQSMLGPDVEFPDMQQQLQKSLLPIAIWIPENPESFMKFLKSA